MRDLIDDNMKDAKVEMTRDGDYFVTLQGRSNMANRKQADIFVSIHANAIDKKSPLHSSINGAAVYTLGLRKSETNLSIAMRENEVMKLEPDYSTTYQGFDPSSTESYIAFEMMQHSNMDQHRAGRGSAERTRPHRRPKEQRRPSGSILGPRRDKHAGNPCRARLHLQSGHGALHDVGERSGQTRPRNLPRHREIPQGEIALQSGADHQRHTRG